MGRGPGVLSSLSGPPGCAAPLCFGLLGWCELQAVSTGTSVHAWTCPRPAGSGQAGGGPGGGAGPRQRAPERAPCRPGRSSMMPGETHPAAPGPADLARCQGCASLQQVRGSLDDPFELSWGRVPVLCLFPDSRIGSPGAMLVADRVSLPYRAPSSLVQIQALQG